MLEALLADEEHFKVLINALPDKDFSIKLFDLPTIRKQLDMAIPATFTEEERNELCLFFYQGGYAVIRDMEFRKDNLNNRFCHYKKNKRID